MTDPFEADVELRRWLTSKEFDRLVAEGISKYLSDPGFGLPELAEHLRVSPPVAKGLIDGLAAEIRRRDCGMRKTIAARAARRARPDGRRHTLPG